MCHLNHLTLGDASFTQFCRCFFWGQTCEKTKGTSTDFHAHSIQLLGVQPEGAHLLPSFDPCSAAAQKKRYRRPLSTPKPPSATTWGGDSFAQEGAKKEPPQIPDLYQHVQPFIYHVIYQVLGKLNS